jgi:hypothetical protein
MSPTAVKKKDPHHRGDSHRRPSESLIAGKKSGRHERNRQAGASPDTLGGEQTQAHHQNRGKENETPKTRRSKSFFQTRGDEQDQQRT